MSKSPEEYFREQSFGTAPQTGKGTAFSDTELAFMRKYMGLDSAETLKKIGLTPAPVPAPLKPVPVPAAASQPVVPDTPEPAAEKSITAAPSPTPKPAVAPPASKPVTPSLSPAPAQPESSTPSVSTPVSAGVALSALEAALLRPAPAVTPAAGAKPIVPAVPSSPAPKPAIAPPAPKPATPSPSPAPAQPAPAAPSISGPVVAVAALPKPEAALLKPAPAVTPAAGPKPAIVEEERVLTGAAQALVEAASALTEAASALSEAAPKPLAQSVPTPATAASAPPAQPVSKPAPAVPTPIRPVPTVQPPVPPVAPAPTSVKTPAEVKNSLRDTSEEHEYHAETVYEKDLDALMRSEPELQMVGFYLGAQEFTVPTIAVQEVIRFQTPAKLPSAPEFVAGVINLRGKMTPLVYLRDMLEINQERKTDDHFIIVCRRKGLQFGLIIERVHTMYRVPQSDIDWGIEAHLGINVDLISGLLKLGDNLVAIVSVDRIVDYVLEKE